LARIIGTAFLVLTLCTLSTGVSSPERSKGISMHMLPKRVADLGGGKWGLAVTYAKYLKIETELPTLQTTKEFLSFVRKQDESVQQNGVWIVITDPDAYSAAETALLADIKVVCQKESIPLFVCRGVDLPNGWKRYDKPH
jgi:hypothetical protein